MTVQTTEPATRASERACSCCLAIRSSSCSGRTARVVLDVILRDPVATLGLTLRPYARLEASV